MNHTPGPWTVEVLEEITFTGERRPASYISSSQGWANSGMAGKRTIAIVGHWKDRPNPEADARLIASAPELDAKNKILLEALTTIVSMGLDCPRLATAQRIAEHAIAKAKERFMSFICHICDTDYKDPGGCPTCLNKPLVCPQCHKAYVRIVYHRDSSRLFIHKESLAAKRIDECCYVKGESNA